MKKFNPNSQDSLDNFHSECQAWVDRFGSRVGVFEVFIEMPGWMSDLRRIDSPRSDLRTLLDSGSPFPMSDECDLFCGTSLVGYEIKVDGSALFSFLVNWDTKYSVAFTFDPEGTAEGEADQFGNSISVITESAICAEGWECISIHDISTDDTHEYSCSDVEGLAPELIGNFSIVKELTQTGWEEEYLSDKIEGDWKEIQACFARKEFADLAREALNIL